MSPSFKHMKKNNKHQFVRFKVLIVVVNNNVKASWIDSYVSVLLLYILPGSPSKGHH